MNRIPLRLCTVSDARWYYLNGKPIRFESFQSFGGKDSKGNNPSISLDEKLNSSFVPDGSLKWKSSKDNYWSVIPNWLLQSDSGPYYTPVDKSFYYYLGGDHSDYDGYYWMQICSNPLNALSEDCMDEVNIWIPAL